MNSSTSIAKIAPALLSAQKEMGNAKKEAENPFFKSKFANLNSVREAVTPALHANGISILQPMTHVDGRNFIQTTLLHESGEFVSSMTEVVCAKQSDPQSLGSAISYARRYSLSALLSIGAEDDDSEIAMGRNKSVAKAAPTISTPVMTANTTNVQSSNNVVLPTTTVVKPTFRKAAKPKVEATTAVGPQTAENIDDWLS